MAVPTDFPEDVLLLDILLEQLLITVRQLMAYRRREAAANAITLSNRRKLEYFLIFLFTSFVEKKKKIVNLPPVVTIDILRLNKKIQNFI